MAKHIRKKIEQAPSPAQPAPAAPTPAPAQVAPSAQAPPTPVAAKRESERRPSSKPKESNPKLKVPSKLKSKSPGSIIMYIIIALIVAWLLYMGYKKFKKSKTEGTLAF